MIAKSTDPAHLEPTTVMDIDHVECAPTLTVIPPAQTSDFVDLPQEILENIFMRLSLTERLSLIRTCTAIHEIHQSSAKLQYDFALRTSAYVDVPFFPQGEASTDDDDEIEEEDVDTVPQQIPTVSRRPAAKPSLPPLMSPLSAHEKNARLRDRERRWETLDYAAKRIVKVGGRAGVYELQEGIFLMCDEFSDVDDSKPRGIRLIPLPSASDPDLERAPLPTQAKKTKFEIADLTMDPTQDLLVVSEYRPSVPTQGAAPPTHRIHLLSLSTFDPHPLASLPALDFPPMSQTIMQTRQLLQVMGDVLVVLVSRYAAHWLLAGLGVGMAALAGLGSEEEIVCWNWKTGRVLARLALPENGWFASFALLTPTTFMITSTSAVSAIVPEPQEVTEVFPPVIQIFSITPDPNYSIIPVQPLSLEHMDDTTARPVLLAQLELPRLAHHTAVSSFDIRPDPAFHPQRSQVPNLRSTKPFTQDPDKGIVVLDIHITEAPEDPDAPAGQMGATRTEGFEMFVLRETFVQLAKEGEERLRMVREENAGEGNQPWRVEIGLKWEEWGEKGCRIMDISMKRRQWVCTCSGYRFAALTPSNPTRRRDNDPDDEGGVPQMSRMNIRLLDFSPYSQRRPLSAMTEDRETQVTVHRAPTVLSKKRIWKEDVKSELAYQEVVAKWGVSANGIIIDDERLIVIATRGRGNGDWSNISQEMTVYCM